MATLSLFCEKCKKLVAASPLTEESADGALGLCPDCGSRLFPNRRIEPGTKINGFRIDREIGRGGMGVVYLARQLNLDRDVAFKILSDEMASDTAFVQAFFHEARAAAALNHPNIVQAFDAGVGPGNLYYFVMELIEGENLEVYTARHGALDFNLAFKCATSIADALMYAWNYKKLAHRDIKPENIILKNTDEFKLADLGLAKDYHEGAAAADTDTMATPAYASPEVIRCESGVDGFKSDMYSFGATLYQLFSGHPPFVDDDPNVVCEMQLNRQPKPLIGINPLIPSRLSMLVDKLMEKSPEKRPPSWDIVSEELNQIADVWYHRQTKAATELQLKMKEEEELAVKQKKMFGAVIAGLLLIVGLLLVVFFVLKDKPENHPASELPQNTAGIVDVPTIDDAAQTESESVVPVAPDPWAELKPILEGKSSYQRWCLLRDFLNLHGEQAADEAKQICRSIDNAVRVPTIETLRRRYQQIKQENTPKNYRRITDENEFIRMNSDLASFLKMVEEMPLWAAEVCDEKELARLKKMPAAIQRHADAFKNKDKEKDLARRRAQIRKAQKEAFAKICRGLRSTDRADAENAVNEWLKEYDSTLSPDDRASAARLLRLIGDLHTPLYKLLDDNKDVLAGKEIFPRFMPDEFFYKADENALSCKTNQDGIMIVKKAPWSTLEKDKRGLICSLIFAKNTLAKLNEKTQVILFEQAVFQNVPLEKLKEEYRKKLKLSPDEETKFFSALDLLPPEVYTK